MDVCRGISRRGLAARLRHRRELLWWERRERQARRRIFDPLNAIAHVQDAGLGSGTNSNAVQCLAFSANPTVGNYICAFAWGWTSGSHTFTGGFTDTGGNTYTLPTGYFKDVASDLFGWVGFTKVASTAATFRVTATISTAFSGSLMCCAAEFSGIAASSPQDGALVGTSGTTGTAAPGSLTPAAGSLVVALYARDDTTFVASTPTGFTRIAFQNDGTNFEVGEAVYQIAPAGATNPTWNNTTTGWVAEQYALLSATGGVAPSLSGAFPLRANNQGHRPAPFRPGLAR